MKICPVGYEFFYADGRAEVRVDCLEASNRFSQIYLSAKKIHLKNG